MNDQRNIKVSVIVATYNYGHFIDETLRSVQAQTFSDWECLVIDDASTDDTAAVVLKFVDMDPRFRYIRFEKNQGVSMARNRGFAEAKGEYIQLLDADDVIAPQKLEVHTAYLDRNKCTSVVYSDFVRFTGAVDLSLPGELKSYEKLSGIKGRIISQLLRGNIFRLNTVLIRKRILDTVEGFRDQFLYIEDWDFWMRIALKGFEFKFLDDQRCIVGVRVAHDSLSNDKPAMRRYHLPVRQHVWIHGGLTFNQRISLLLRYCDHCLEMLLIRREPIIFLKEGGILFKVLIGTSCMILFPFWVIYRLLIRPFR